MKTSHKRCIIIDPLSHCIFRVMANYLMWQVVRYFSSDLDSRFRDVFQEYRKSIIGTTDDDPRWQECLSISNHYLGMPFSLLYVDETFEGESKKSVRKSGN